MGVACGDWASCEGSDECGRNSIESEHCTRSLRAMAHKRKMNSLGGVGRALRNCDR